MVTNTCVSKTKLGKSQGTRIMHQKGWLGIKSVKY